MLRLFWLGPLVLLQACAGTPVAERLERSFAAPQSELSSSGSTSSAPTETSPAAAPSESSVAGDAPEEKAATKKETPKKDPTNKDPTKKELTKDDTTRKDSAPASPALSEPSTPPVSVVSAEEAEPYRITIRLSGADPSAPAEAVTHALRKADVRFAVERIERIQP